MEGISELEDLSSLDLAENLITKIEGVSKLKSLKTLSLSGNNISSELLSGLKNLQQHCMIF